jgi:uncharacterized membrane protein YkgB
MRIKEIDVKISSWLGHHGVTFLRYSMAIVFIWFGFLKVFDYSPATTLVKQTVYWINFSGFVTFLGWWEVVIGFCFMFRSLIRIAIALLIPQMIGTFLPLFLLPEIIFQKDFFLIPTLEGQYIIKNLVIIAAAMVIGATVRKRH